MHCGFILGPRINAAGRLKSAKAALELLTSTSLETARPLAAELERINTERRAAQDGVVAEAKEQALKQLADPRWAELAAAHPAAAFGPWPRALVLAPPPAADGSPGEWHEGVVGIVASKIVEEFGRPAFVLTGKEGAPDTLKGSVRSVSKVDILAAISAESVSCHLTNFGGHAHAGGVTLKRDKLVEFTEAVNLHMALTTTGEQFKRERRFDVEVALSEIDGKLVEELDGLGPFGHQFPEPVLKISNIACADVRVMKEKHLKLRFEGAPRLDAVWFNARRDEKLEAGSPASYWICPQWNEWQGVRRLQLQVKHAELAGAPMVEA
jgi:single-stranded-DNA-specific exonuclease